MSAYPYPTSPDGRYSLLRDGVLLMRGTEQEVWRTLHRGPSSIHHALKHEGFAIEPAPRRYLIRKDDGEHCSIYAETWPGAQLLAEALCGERGWCLGEYGASDE